MKKVCLAILILFISCSSNKKEIYSGVFTGEEYMLKSEVAGKIISFPCNEGDRVAKNDTLILIDDRELRMMVVAMDYKVKNMRVKLKDAGEDLKKAESLFKGSAIPEAEYERAERKCQSIRLELKSAEATLEAKKESLNHFHITTPVSGYISAKYAKEGETAIPGAPLAEILDPTLVYLNIYVPEDILPLVSINQATRVKVDAFPDRTFSGKVIFISKKAEFTPKNIQTREDRTLLVYRVKILMDNSEGLIKPGIYGDAILK